MGETKSHETFPLWIAVFSNFVAISIYILGAYVLAGFGVLAVALYLLYCLWIEMRVLKVSCVECYYYDKFCGFGKGKLSALLFKRGDPKKFVEKQVSWALVLPDFMVVIFPLVGGVILLVIAFNWLLVGVLLVLGVLNFGGNAVIRGSFACKYCRQREIGCPATNLFMKKHEKS